MSLPKVLIVDDDLNMRSLLHDALSTEPYQLLEAVDGQQALETVDREMPDLILLDMMMPVLGGIDVLRRLKAEDRTRPIPVIIITALTAESDVVASIEEGAIDHIAKPFSVLIVRTKVRAALRYRTAASTQRRRRRIGFLGAKGGVGVTTTAVNTALTIVSPQRSVAIVELRPYPGTVAQQLGLTSKRTLQPLLEQPAGTIDEVSLRKCLTPHRSGLEVLLAPSTVDDQREITAQQAKAILTSLSEIFDYVIVDLAFATSKASREAVRCCTFVVLTIELESTCLASAQTLLEGLAGWEVDQDMVGALVVLHHALAGTAITVSHASSQLSCGLIGVVPPAGPANLKALKDGQPLVYSESDSVIAAAYKDLGARLMADNMAEMKRKL